MAGKTARVYLDRGQRAHIVPVDAAGNAAPDAVCVRCGTRPRPWGTWLGTGGKYPKLRRASQQAAARKLALCERMIGR